MPQTFSSRRPATRIDYLIRDRRVGPTISGSRVFNEYANVDSPSFLTVHPSYDLPKYPFPREFQDPNTLDTFRLFSSLPRACRSNMGLRHVNWCNRPLRSARLLRYMLLRGACHGNYSAFQTDSARVLNQRSIVSTLSSAHLKFPRQ